jgi:hypothetical protein
VVLPPWAATGVVGVVLVGAAMALTRGAVGGRRARLAAAARAGHGSRAVPADDGGTNSVWPTLVGAAVSLWYLAARFGGVGGTTQWFTGPGSLSRLMDRLGDAGEILRNEIAPVPGTPPAVLLCVGGALIVLVVADALASGLRHPALAAAPVLVLWFPPLVLMSEVPWGTFAVTVVALLLCLTLDEPRTSRRALRDANVGAQVRRAERRRAVRTTSTAAGVTAVALLVGGAAGGFPVLGHAWSDVFTTPTRSVRLADDLDMYRSLTARSGDVVMSYVTSTGENVGPLRLLTLTRFDGRSWSRGAKAGGRAFGNGDVLFPEQVQLSTDTTKVDVTVGSMREQNLPLSIDPRDVTADGGWRYDPARDELVGGPATQPGDTFTIGVHPRDLSPESLRDAGDGARAVGAAFLEVPQTAHKDDIAQKARDVVGDAATPYDEAVALQGYLRDTSNFTYNVDVPRGRTGDAVYDFLQQRTGYCVQFATTMVVLARTLGIPARLAIGYLPGHLDEDRAWKITGEDSHAWPELYFPGSGWVRFEPTPAVQTGALPVYADPNAGATGPSPTPSIDERNHPTSSATASAAAPSSTVSLRPAAGAAEPRTALAEWSLIGGVVVIVAAGLLVLWLRRRRTPTSLDAEEAWSSAVDALTAAGVTLPTATTPRRAPGDAAAAWRAVLGNPLPDVVRDGLAELAEALEVSRYAADAEPVDSDRLAQVAREVATGIAAAARSARDGAGDRQLVGAGR